MEMKETVDLEAQECKNLKWAMRIFMAHFNNGGDIFKDDRNKGIRNSILAKNESDY